MRIQSIFVWSGLMLVVMVGWQPKAMADETGFAGIHSWVKVGRKTCLADHFHTQSGTGSTKKEAQRAAARAWSEFTAWEYGTSWASFRRAASRSIKCSKSDTGWSCVADARACRKF